MTRRNAHVRVLLGALIAAVALLGVGSGRGGCRGPAVHVARPAGGQPSAAPSEAGGTSPTRATDVASVARSLELDPLYVSTAPGTLPVSPATSAERCRRTSTSRCCRRPPRSRRAGRRLPCRAPSSAAAPARDGPRPDRGRRPDERAVRRLPHPELRPAAAGARRRARPGCAAASNPRRPWCSRPAGSPAPASSPTRRRAERAGSPDRRRVPVGAARRRRRGDPVRADPAPPRPSSRGTSGAAGAPRPRRGGLLRPDHPSRQRAGTRRRAGTVGARAEASWGRPGLINRTRQIIRRVRLRSTKSVAVPLIFVSRAAGTAGWDA